MTKFVFVDEEFVHTLPFGGFFETGSTFAPVEYTLSVDDNLLSLEIQTTFNKHDLKDLIDFLKAAQARLE